MLVTSVCIADTGSASFWAARPDGGLYKRTAMTTKITVMILQAAPECKEQKSFAVTFNS